MLLTSTQQNVRRLRHERAVIFVPRPGSALDQEIDPGSGIVGVMNGERPVLYFEGNRFNAVNLQSPEERVICAFGRLATAYPTVAMRGVLPHEFFDLVRVGQIGWPNAITWDSPAAAQIFLDYVGRYQGNAPMAGGGLSRLSIMEMDMTSLLGYYDDPSAFEEWRWIEGAARFVHVGNNIEPGVFEFMVRVPIDDSDTYQSEPPAKVAMVIDIARKMGATWVLFHQG